MSVPTYDKFIEPILRYLTANPELTLKARLTQLLSGIQLVALVQVRQC